MFVYDDWQRQLKALKKGNVIVLGGRQIGKSVIFAEVEGDYLLENKGAHLLIVSGVERQAAGLYNKVIAYIDEKNPKAIIKKGKHRSMKTVTHLKNGSILRTEPVGEAGAGARQHTFTRVVFEEMQLIPEEAFAAITPMLFTTGGDIHMLGTAWSTEGYVYERLSDPDFRVFRIDAEDVAEKRPEPQRSIMLQWLEKERKRMTTAQYMQEYKAIPSDKLRQIYPDALVAKAMQLSRSGYDANGRHAIGIDPAALGQDEGAITVVELKGDLLKQKEFMITKNLLSTQFVEQVVELDKKVNARKIYVDDGGVGFGVFSGLMTEPSTKGKTVPLNNASRPLDRDDTRRKRILKEDLHTNLLYLLEQGKILLLKDPEIRESLKSFKYEYEEKTKKLRITSNYNHPGEALTRAAWFIKDKGLNLWAASYSNVKNIASW